MQSWETISFSLRLNTASCIGVHQKNGISRKPLKSEMYCKLLIELKLADVAV